MRWSKSRALTVYVVWHPHDVEAADLATMLLRSVLADPESPWAERLGVPVKFRTSIDHRSVPRPIDLDASDSTVTVILWGDALGADRGNVWRDWVADLVGKHDDPNGAHRLVNATLSENGLGAVDTFGNLNTTRLHLRPQQRHADDLLAAVLRTSVLALEPEPVTVFVSHAKPDAAVAEELVRVINDERLGTFFDAHAIQDGTSSLDTIVDALDRSAIIAVFSDTYPTRARCRLELLHSRQRGRPVVLLDVLDRGGVRTMPHLDNIPIIRLGTSAATRYDVTIEYLLREVVRHRFFQRRVQPVIELLESTGTPPPLILPRAPDPLAMIAMLGATGPSMVIYPDPPLGPPEREILEQLRPGLEALTATEWRARA